MFNYPYLVELLSPKRSTGDRMEDFLDRFKQGACYNKRVIKKNQVSAPNFVIKH